MDGQTHPPAREVIAAVDRWSREAVLAAADEIARRPAREAPPSPKPREDEEELASHDAADLPRAVRRMVVVGGEPTLRDGFSRTLVWAAMLTARGCTMRQERVRRAVIEATYLDHLRASDDARVRAAYAEALARLAAAPEVGS